MTICALYGAQLYCNIYLDSIRVGKYLPKKCCLLQTTMIKYACQTASNYGSDTLTLDPWPDLNFDLMIRWHRSNSAAIRAFIHTQNEDTVLRQKFCNILVQHTTGIREAQNALLIKTNTVEHVGGESLTPMFLISPPVLAVSPFSDSLHMRSGCRESVAGVLHTSSPGLTMHLSSCVMH